MSGQIPRGLMTRQGSPVKPSTRLPSLRRETIATASTLLPAPAAASSSTTLPFVNRLSLPGSKGQPVTTIAPLTGSPTKTRGGAVKRVFKPIIPSLRNGSSDEKRIPDVDPVSSKDRQLRGQDNIRRSDSRKGGTGVTLRNGQQTQDKRRNRPPVNLVQLESSVFTGITAAPTQSRGKRVSQSVSSGGNIVKSEKKPPCDPKPLSDLMKDDFIATSSEEDDDSDDEKRTKYSKTKPIGWDALYFDEKEENPVVRRESPLNHSVGPGLLFTPDKMFLMQLPDTIVPSNEEELISSDGYIGKMRVYSSGRVEFVDETVKDNVSIYDCLPADANVTSIPVKEEDGSEKLMDLAIQIPASCMNCTQHVIHLDTEEGEAISCGILNPVEKVILVPDPASDSQILR